MPFLRDLYAEPWPEISSYAGCVLMVELALQCFDHGWEDDRKGGKQGFWDNHYTLLKATDKRFAMLKMHLNAKSVREDPVAFSVYMNLRATEILFHEVAIARVEQQGLLISMAADSQKRSVAAAFKIANAVRLNWPGQQTEHDVFTLQATFLAWPIVMAMKALSRDLVPPNQHKDEAVNGLVASFRLLLAALDHIEETGGYWHGRIGPVATLLMEWDESGFDSVAL